MNSFRNCLRLMRPAQWLKNVFVFTGIIFGGSIYNAALMHAVIMAAAAFCLISSGIYIFNDIMDIDNDRAHPTKKNRPLPAGQVTIGAASLLCVCCLSVGGYLALTVSFKVFWILVFYIFLNLAYTLRLKHVVILDVFCIATGFMMRILVGTIGVGVPPSKWLLLCGLLMALFLGFAKRRAELSKLKGVGGEHRYVLQNYDPALLDILISICATGVIIGYSLYTMSPQTIRLHGTDNLMYTVPFVIYAIFRYLYLMHRWGHGGDPTKDLIRDKHIVASVCCWIVLTVYVLNR